MAETSLNVASGTALKAPTRSRLVFGPFTLDTTRGELLRDGEAIALRPKAFDLLVLLASRPGEVLAKDQLIAAVWPGVVVTDDSLTQCVHEVRSALGVAGTTLIHTVPRRGYRFEGDVRPESSAALGAPGDARDASVPIMAVGPHATVPPIRQHRRLALLLGSLLLIGVIALSTWAWNRLNRTAPAAIPPLSIVLLPLESGEETSAWFADALTADLTAELGRMASAFVISSATAFTYRGKAADPREVSRALGVRYVVRGMVRRSGERVRLELTMIDGASGAQHWAQSFDIERAGLGASLDDIVLQVARSLNVQMYRSEGRRSTLAGSEQVRAEDLAMQGWGVYFRGLSRENLLVAQQLFEQALAKDSHSILGWGGVAVINGLGARIGWLPDRDAAIRRLELASARLDDLDSEHLFALLAKQHVTFLRGDYEAHVLVTRMTIQRYPNHAPSYSGLSGGLVNLGRFDECVELTQRAIRLSPRDPLLGAWHLNIGICEFLRGEYKEATASARLSVQLSPTLPVPPLLLAASLARSGQPDEARAIIAAYMQRYPNHRTTEVTKLMRSEHPLYAAGRARLIDSLHELGMP